MATVNTVLGPVDTSELGFTLSHEHIMTGAAGMRHTYPEFADYQGVIEDAVVTLRGAYEEGLRTMIDMSTFDIGRNIEMLAEVSRRSGINIIPTTGSHRSIPRATSVPTPGGVSRGAKAPLGQESRGVATPLGARRVPGGGPPPSSPMEGAGNTFPAKGYKSNGRATPSLISEA